MGGGNPQSEPRSRGDQPHGQGDLEHDDDEGDSYDDADKSDHSDHSPELFLINYRWVAATAVAVLWRRCNHHYPLTYLQNGKFMIILIMITYLRLSSLIIPSHLIKT